MRALIIGDVHLSDNPPSIRTDTYTDDILAKLEFCIEKANQEKVDAVIQAGDLFHVKAPSRTSHRLVQRTIDVLSQSTAPVLILPGNHDIQHDRLQSLPAQPLGTVAKAPGIEILIGPHSEFPVFGVPYLADYQAQLPGWLRRYNEWADKLHARNWDVIPLLVTHAPIFPPSEDPPFEYITAEDWAHLMQEGDCYYGHIHDPHGMYEIGAVRLCNQGAISRGSLHEKTLTRVPAVSLWSSFNGYNGFQRVPVPYKPATEVFRLAEKNETDSRSQRVAEFLDGVEKTTFETLTVEQVVAHAEGMGLRPRTLDELRDVIEEVSSR